MKSRGEQTTAQGPISVWTNATDDLPPINRLLASVLIRIDLVYICHASLLFLKRGDV